MLVRLTETVSWLFLLLPSCSQSPKSNASRVLLSRGSTGDHPKCHPGHSPAQQPALSRWISPKPRFSKKTVKTLGKGVLRHTHEIMIPPGPGVSHAPAWTQQLREASANLGQGPRSSGGGQEATRGARPAEPPSSRSSRCQQPAAPTRAVSFPRAPRRAPQGGSQPACRAAPAKPCPQSPCQSPGVGSVSLLSPDLLPGSPDPAPSLPRRAPM